MSKPHYLCVFSINVKVKEGSFIGIVGQVGSGKSTLLSAILGETEKLTGDVTVKVFKSNAHFASLSVFQSVNSLPSARQHPSYGDCLEVKTEYYQSCSVLDCVTQYSPSEPITC